MGIDIHIYIERKNEQGTWEEVKIDPRLIPDKRDHGIWAVIAGVGSVACRGDALFAERGFPNDTSYKSEILLFGKTHVYWDEFLNQDGWTHERLRVCMRHTYFGAFLNHVLGRILDNRYPSSLDKRSVRMLIGFDN
jgi:hypothetical protein